MDLKEYILSVENFPKNGITFRDISPLLNNSKAFNYAIDKLSQASIHFNFSHIIGIESRGFILASALAYEIRKPLIIARKPNKLPPPVITQKYGLEYGEDSLEIKTNLGLNHNKILIVDDVLATGGTVIATKRLIEKIDCYVAGALFLIELGAVKGEEQLKKNNIKHSSLISY